MFDHGWPQSYEHSRDELLFFLQIHIPFQLINHLRCPDRHRKCRWVA
jgi:hypothetical protein